MDVVFTNAALLDVELDDSVLGVAVEKAWRGGLRQTATRALAKVGAGNRVPFVLAADGSLDFELSALFRAVAGQVRERTTMASYTHHASTFLRYLNQRDLKWISAAPAELAAYKKVRNAGLNPISWNSEAAAIKSLFDAAIALGFRRDNPCTSPTLTWYNRNPASPGQDAAFVSLTRFAKFRDHGLAAGPYGLRNVAFANLLLAGGLRLEEGNAWQADWLADRDIRKARRGVPYIVPADAAKGRRARKVRISRAAVQSMRMYAELLREDQAAKAIVRGKYREPPEALWLNQSALPMAAIGWGEVFRRASQRTGLKVTPKTLRLTCAVYLLGRLVRDILPSADAIRSEAGKLAGSSTGEVYGSILGDPLRKVQKYLGHARYESTFIYLDVLASHGIDDAELTLFDQLFDMSDIDSGVAA